jgi:thioredoxin-like negative regulator of GroEL
LKRTLVKVAPSYSPEQVLLCTIDADINSDLQKYLQGGYPTVRVFSKGKTTGNLFVGSKSETFVRQFIDKVIRVEAAETDGNVKEITSLAEFNDIIAKAQVPVVMKISMPG